MRKKYIYFLLLSFLFSGSSFSQTRFTLQKALQTARENNSVLRTEKFNIGIAKSDVTTAGLRPNPVMGISYISTIRKQDYAENTGLLNSANTQTSLQLGKIFQIAGQRKNAIDLAEKTAVATENTYHETERTLYLEVAGKWMEVWAAQKKLALIQAAKSNIDSLANINKYRYTKQVITQTDLYRTELLARQYALQAKTAQQEIINKQKELKFFLGIKVEVTADISDDFLYRIPSGIDSLLQQSLHNRSDILSSRLNVEAASSNIRLQRSLAIPSPEIGVVYNPQNRIPYVGAYLTFELPFFSRNQGERQKAVLLKQQAEQQFSTIQSRIGTEVTNAYADYEFQKQSLEKFENMITQAQTILNNVKYAYLRGGTTIIDFLEAQRSWLEIQQQYYDTLELYKQSIIQLLYVTGLINQLAK
ncbi:TolC family protein [Chryseobacterium populi]|uniref:Outer membrane protein n=1 Tax=Chryseobacterium populi TaxID=1144316 RepID=J2T0E1_9FLAO|nr:TolC family protein [Chryseobacterium populi]EJL71427.1 outer membrane protein [Chryseobacterium populi]